MAMFRSFSLFLALFVLADSTLSCPTVLKLWESSTCGGAPNEIRTVNADGSCTTHRGQFASANVRGTVFTLSKFAGATCRPDEMFAAPLRLKQDVCTRTKQLGRFMSVMASWDSSDCPALPVALVAKPVLIADPPMATPAPAHQQAARDVATSGTTGSTSSGTTGSSSSGTTGSTSSGSSGTTSTGSTSTGSTSSGTTGTSSSGTSGSSSSGTTGSTADSTTGSTSSGTSGSTSSGASTTGSTSSGTTGSTSTGAGSTGSTSSGSTGSTSTGDGLASTTSAVDEVVIALRMAVDCADMADLNTFSRNFVAALATLLGVPVSRFRVHEITHNCGTQKRAAGEAAVSFGVLADPTGAGPSHTALTASFVQHVTDGTAMTAFADLGTFVPGSIVVHNPAGTTDASLAPGTTASAAAPATTAAAVPATSSTTSRLVEEVQQDDASSGLSAGVIGAIVGGVVGGAVLVTLVILVVVIVIRRKRLEDSDPVAPVDVEVSLKQASLTEEKRAEEVELTRPSAHGHLHEEKSQYFNDV